MPHTLHIHILLFGCVCCFEFFFVVCVYVLFLHQKNLTILKYIYTQTHIRRLRICVCELDICNFNLYFEKKRNADCTTHQSKYNFSIFHLLPLFFVAVFARLMCFFVWLCWCEQHNMIKKTKKLMHVMKCLKKVAMSRKKVYNKKIASTRFFSLSLSLEFRSVKCMKLLCKISEVQTFRTKVW